jgi:hypothetical protein
MRIGKEAAKLNQLDEVNRMILQYVDVACDLWEKAVKLIKLRNVLIEIRSTAQSSENPSVLILKNLIGYIF